MAGLAIPPQWSLVRIVFLVTIKARLRSVLQGGWRAGAGMAIGAWQIDMLPGQRKRQAGVIEIGPISVHAIVADKAIRAECIDMRWDKIGLNDQVALRTCDLVKTANIPGMAISTLKRSSIRHVLVADQGKTYGFVRKSL